MRVFIKDLGSNIVEAWVEDWLPGTYDWQVVCEANCFIIGKQCLVDTIDTKYHHRRKGYATALIKELQKYFNEVQPIGVTSSGAAFWKKLGLEDALGEER